MGGGLLDFHAYGAEIRTRGTMWKRAGHRIRYDVSDCPDEPAGNVTNLAFHLGADNEAAFQDPALAAVVEVDRDRWVGGSGRVVSHAWSNSRILFRRRWVSEIVARS